MAPDRAELQPLQPAGRQARRLADNRWALELEAGQRLRLQCRAPGSHPAALIGWHWRGAAEPLAPLPAGEPQQLSERAADGSSVVELGPLEARHDGLELACSARNPSLPAEELVRWAWLQLSVLRKYQAQAQAHQPAPP